MGEIIKHLPVKLIVGFIFKENSIYKKAKSLLIRKFGALDFQSPSIPFTHTDYYEKEIGKGLSRCFISFKKLIPAQCLSRIKLLTNKTEIRLSNKGSRLINIDPGYLELSKFVLASTKDFNHRIYLDKGVFAEITLFYRDKTFRGWEWTYPDYKTPEYIEIFNHIRHIYENQIRNSKSGGRKILKIA